MISRTHESYLTKPECDIYQNELFSSIEMRLIIFHFNLLVKNFVKFTLKVTTKVSCSDIKCILLSCDVQLCT